MAKGWIVQQYEGNVHVVPDTEPGHILGPDCFCVPAALMENEVGGLLVIHHDKLDREVENPKMPRVSSRPQCPYCGNIAPYGDERHMWMRVHLDSRLHRWWWKLKKPFRRSR
jgi:hypothetical protein